MTRKTTPRLQQQLATAVPTAPPASAATADDVDAYEQFLLQKGVSAPSYGFDVALDDISSRLFDWQRAIVRWALQRGRAAIFADCGLGKTAMQLEWAWQVQAQTRGDVLILAPLAVAAQTRGEAEKFGYEVTVCRDQADVRPGINITNYEMLAKFDAGRFAGVVLDESSILKSYMGKTKRALIEAFAETPYRLCCTATPAPNDHMEIGNHSEFLGVMPSTEMLMRWFINDTMAMGNYRLKGHAVADFWQWVASWAVSLRHPSDLGYSDDGFILPALNIRHETVEVDLTTDRSDGQLFRTPDLNATGLHREMRRTTADRADAVARLVNGDDGAADTWVVWCNTNYEADALMERIPDALEVRGSESLTEKERKLQLFTAGGARVLVTKPSIAGWGLNWQHCHRMAFVGLSYSYEQFYQATRRCWRFGQTEPVECVVVAAQTEGPVLATIDRKLAAHEEMAAAMVASTRKLVFSEELALRRVESFTQHQGGDWTLYHGDSVRVAATLPDASMHFSIFSPPFSSLYTYSDAVEDMGNCADDAEFFAQFDFLIHELHRITIPGRLCAVHCKQLVNYKGRDGMAGLRDFRGEIIRHFTDAGWAYHSEVCIWKDPVIEMQRTKAHGLLYKQLRADSSVSRQGMAEYLLVFRRWPHSEAEDASIEPVTHTKDDFPLDTWQRYASPVWMDIRQTRVLNVEQARDSQDEKHICLAKGSLVLTRDGHKAIEDIQVGDLVLTHTGRWMPVTAKRCNGVRPTIRLTAQGVADLRLTPEHNVWTRRGRTTHPRAGAIETQPEWMPASETLGSYVNLKLPPIEESNLTADEWWIVGRWLGDGHLSVRGLPHISCNHNESDDLIARLGEHCGHVARNATATQIYVKDRDGKVGGRIHDMIRRCGAGATNKRVPAEALALDVEKSEALLAGYLSADGHYVARYDRSIASSVSRALLLGMAMVAQRARGVAASVYAGRPEGETTIEGRTVHTHQDWVLSIPPRNLSGFLMDDGAWKKVREITTADEAEVWDIQVAEDASFTAEGCIVHNCPLQLDVIERALDLWTNPGDVVFSPFAGIGSEGVVALQKHRRFVGVELKERYLQFAMKHLTQAEREANAATLWDGMDGVVGGDGAATTNDAIDQAAVTA